MNPGLAAAGTVTDDFASAIISPDGAKKDRDHVGPRLAKSRYAGIAALAQGGMRLLEQSCVPLNAPSEDDVNDTIEQLRKIYSEAYGWDAPRLAPLEQVRRHVNGDLSRRLHVQNRTTCRK